MSILTLIIAVFSIGIGFSVLWANPERWLNRVFWATAFLNALWLACIYGALQTGARGSTIYLIFWLKANGALAGFFPLGIWFMKEAVINTVPNRRTAMQCLPWIAFGLFLAVLSNFDSFAIFDRGNERIQRGSAYYIHAVMMICACLSMAVNSIRETRNQTGIRRIEMQFLALNFGVATLIAVLLTTGGNLIQSAILKRMSVIVIFSAYAICAWAMTARKIFNVRQVFISLAQRVGLIIFLVIGSASATWVATHLMSPLAALTLSIACICSLAFWLDHKSREWLDLDGERHLIETRRAFIEVALKESNPNDLTLKFGALLCEHCQTDCATLLLDSGQSHSSPTMEFRKQRAGYQALCAMGWATPESLERLRPDPSLADLHHFLTQNKIGALVVSPRGSRQPSLLVALGTKNYSWPFTYPEVERLQNIAELMDNVLTRARLATQAAAQAKIEHLAMMSRGLAHDLRNLITPISTFLVHTENRFSVGSPEAEVHGSARHSVQVMADYVREALFFSERLSPNFQSVDPIKLFSAVRELAARFAAERQVKIVTIARCEDSFSADFVLLQRMLMNLVSNAIDASKPGQCVSISAASGNRGRVLLEVSDEGCGVAAENIGKIFDPYFTTKEYGAEVRGFGLGLTICQKIVHLHKGTISVTSQPNRGATFVIDLPVGTPAVVQAPIMTQTLVDSR